MLEAVRRPVLKNKVLRLGGIIIGTEIDLIYDESVE